MKEDPEYMEKKREYWREIKRAKREKMKQLEGETKPKNESNRKYKGDKFILISPVA